MVAVEPPLGEQVGDHGFIVIAGDGLAQRGAQGEAERGVQFAMCKRGGPDEDFAACVTLAVMGFLARIEGGELGFELALAGEQFISPLIERLTRHRDSMR